MDYDLIIVAGEPSGDAHAASILQELKFLNPNLKIAAVCGPQMKAAYKLHEILSIEKLSVMGFVDVFKNIPRLFFCYKLILKFILKNPAKTVLFIDYPGMNLKLAKTLRNKGFNGNIWHYIAPTAWAWKKNRVKTLKENCDKLFCILPFEESFFKSFGINAHYIGHPLVQKLETITIEKDPYLVSLFPGSRVHEIKKNLKTMLEGCSLLIKDNPKFHFGVSIANNKFKNLIESIVFSTNFTGSIEYYNSSSTRNLMQKSALAIAKSGTCNLELALLGTKTIVVYAISPLDAFIAKHIFKINLPFYSLPNLILNKEIFPELYGPKFTVGNLEIAKNNLLNKVVHTKELITILGKSNPSAIIANCLNN